MHSKKHKNKNRQNKVQNPTTSQNKTDVALEDKKVENLQLDKKEIDLQHGERVPEIVSETLVPLSCDVMETEGGAPKKPKRNRGKKKKQDKNDEIYEDRKENVKVTVQTDKVEEDIKYIDDEDVENKDVSTKVFQTECNNINKMVIEDSIGSTKTVEISKCSPEETKPVITEEGIQTTPSFTIVEEECRPTRKNRKKKHRHDLKKLDKDEEVSCTVAFQNIMNIKDENENKQSEFNIISEQSGKNVGDSDTLNDKNKSNKTKTEQTEIKLETTILDEMIKDNVSHDNTLNITIKNKNKNKKDKNFCTSSKSEVDNTNKVPMADTPGQAEINSEAKISVKEQSPERLLKIEKTCETVVKIKESLGDISCEDSCPIEVPSTGSILSQIQSPVVVDIETKISNQQEDSDTMTGCPSKEKSVPTGIEPSKVSLDYSIEKDKQDPVFLKAPEKMSRKKRKKSPKHFHIKHGSSTDDKFEEHSKENKSLELDVEEIAEVRSMRASESEGSTGQSPDFIEYPRSTSEQLLDNNNNMVIRDISGVKDIKPEEIYMTNKVIIEGSGETPMTSPEVASGNKSEKDIIHTKENVKTDLKSKVIEVNKDMEDLRLSIEKSLAELTAIETSKNESEEKIEKITTDVKTKTKKKQLNDDDHQLSLTKKEIDDININSGEPTLSDTPVSISQSDALISSPKKDNKGKEKKQKVKQEKSSASTSESSSIAVKDSKQEVQKEEVENKEAVSTEEKEKQQADSSSENKDGDQIDTDICNKQDDPIDNFEDALTSSAEDANKTFEMIANETNHAIETSLQSPEISITESNENTDNIKKQEKKSPLSQPKNLLGHPDIPVPSNKTDYKKEKNKTPNTKYAKVKIKDAEEIESINNRNKESKESQTESKLKKSKGIAKETLTCMSNNNAEYVYKYSFRKVFLHSACHICKKELNSNRISCNFCNLVFYCNQKHKDEDWPQHQALCVAVSTIVHLKGQKHIYEDTINVTGYNYRLLRMQAIVSCEKLLKRRLVPWEQEVLLYPRICYDVGCREWKQSKLQDCKGCGQISYCIDHPEHLSESHQRWCKSYLLYQKLVCYQQTKGRLEPKLPSRVMTVEYQIPEKINEVLASLYQDKIDMNDIQYAALTQLATAPLTAAYCHQLYTNMVKASGATCICPKSSFTVHVVGAELQFEADGLNKWEIFFLHLRPDIQDLRVVLISPELNPSNLPLNLLGKIKLCEYCQCKNRNMTFDFQDRKSYHDFCASDQFKPPDLVCSFNPSIDRSSYHNGKDTWPSTITSVLKLKIPFVVTSYTLTELNRDLARIKECAGVNYSVVSQPNYNPFASVRPDRNFISDDEMPLLFKNYCFTVICGVFD